STTASNPERASDSAFAGWPRLHHAQYNDSPSRRRVASWLSGSPAIDIERSPYLTFSTRYRWTIQRQRVENDLCVRACARVVLRVGSGARDSRSVDVVRRRVGAAVSDGRVVEVGVPAGDRDAQEVLGHRAHARRLEVEWTAGAEYGGISRVTRNVIEGR